jgi:hypothetical protein
MAYYGTATYGLSEYSSSPQVLTGISNIYAGNEINDGFESDFIQDQILIFDKELSDLEVETLANSSLPYIWDDDTIFLAPLDNDLNAGSLAGSGLNIITWRIYKKLTSEDQYTFLEEQDNSPINYYYDMIVANGISYDYALEGVSDDGRVTTKYFNLGNIVTFNGFWLLDQENNTSFQFLYNIPQVPTSLEREREEFKTFSKYPVIRRGIYQVHRGTLTTVIDEDDDITTLTDALESMEGNELVLKLYTGKMYLVDVYNITNTLTSEEGYETCELRCDWVEVGEAV